MSFFAYLKDRFFPVVLYILVVLIITFILFVFEYNLFIIFDIIFLLCLVGTVNLLYDYFRRKKFYDELFSLLEGIDNKCLIHEMLMDPSFLDGKLVLEVLYETNKYKLDEIEKFKLKNKDLEEFIEMWVHEIKTPLASTSLIMENNPSQVNGDIKKELVKVNDYVEQMLFYARSATVEKDYLVKQVLLETIVKKVILRYKHDFLLKKISLDMYDLDVVVNTDTKWMEFILGQIIGNSIKYTSDNPQIRIYTKRFKESAILFIEDNGIGIKDSDLPRLFDKGFTGENGRMKYNSTGMGLYLVKQLCDKLDHKIKIESNDGTTVMITFPIGSYINEIKKS